MKKEPISEATRTAVLDATWSLMADKKRLDVNLSEVAAAAGVSRQTIYIAFGDRAGLLMAMVQHKDTQSDHVMRLGRVSFASKVTPEDFRGYLEVWFEYLALIYPVAILLDATSVTDKEAAAAWDDRMKGALLAGLKRIFANLAKRRHLAPGWKPDQGAELVWSLIHPTCFRQLVLGCGWKIEEFRRSRLAIIGATLLKQPW
jgi:AcrR family transcriptional regulator